ncbi:MAG TPA: PAS domain S-box protein [Candidatus Dormibacteraeota bacterium]|nr:PAS domain S-box protein [Candidatus Dormibacteraeota bacterium]
MGDGEAEARARRLEALLDLTPEAIFAWDADRRITYWNRGAETCYGWSRDDVLGRDPAALLRTEPPVPIADILRTVTETGEWEGDLVQHARSGARLIAESRWVAERGPSGELVSVLEVNRDVTARRTTERALRDSEERFRQLATSVDEVFFLRAVDSDQYLYISPAVERIFGIPTEEARVGAFAALVHPDDRPALDAQLNAARLGGHPIDAECRIVRADGAVRWIRWRATLVPQDGEGRPACFAGSLDDVSERRVAQDALEEARREADRANRSKSEFLSRMSHELRTPLNAILGFGQLLELEGLGPEHQETVDQILVNGRHLLDLVDEVIDISRIESGHLRLSVEPVRLDEVVDDALRVVRSLASSRNVRLPGGPAGPAAAYVRADRQRLKQVVLNLLTNAVKYNRPGGEVTLACGPVQGGHWRLSVTDTGPGIGEPLIRRLFTPFDRLGAEQTGIEGTGLGLALTKNLVEAHGGRVGVDSSVGRGSTFWVELAAADAPATRPGPDAHDIPVPPARETPATVLYVEDNLSNVRLVERVLARHRPSATLLVAMDANAGLDLAREHRPDVILMDLNLPGLSGAEALRRLRRHPATAGIPVVIVSADATPGQVSRLKAAGAADYLTKPFDLRRLLEIVDRPPRHGAAGGQGVGGTSAAVEAPVLDPAILDGLRELGDSRDDDALLQLLTAFIEETPARLDELVSAAEARDGRTLHAVAHRLRGSSASFGARQVSDRCTRLQALVELGDLDRAPFEVGEARREFDLAHRALIREFPGLSGGC